MIIHDMEQGTEEWFAVRLGIPTASKFSDIFTSQGKPSASQNKYMNLLVAEWLMGERVETYQNDAMARGNELEPEARTYYELQSDVDVEQTGFITTDDGLIGGSPDGLTALGGLEIKCPSAHVHVEYLLSGKCPAKYLPQVQGLMFLTGKTHWDFVSYYPEMPRQLIVRVERDEKWIEGFAVEIQKFNAKLLAMREKLSK